MCGPVAMGVAMMAMAAATTAYQMKEQKDQAKKQRDMAKESAALKEQAAQQAYAIDMERANAQAEQVQQAGEVEQFERVRQAAKEAATIRVASAEAGVMGNSLFRMLASSNIQKEHDLGIIDANVGNQLKQIETEKKAAGANLDSRLGDAKMTKKSADLYQGPSGTAMGLGIGSAGLQGFMSGYTMMGSTPKPAGTGATGGMPYIPGQ